VANIAPAGTATLGAGLWGQLDLAGELFEWNLDEWALAYVDPCTDCVVTETPGGFLSRVIRGGYFYGDASDLLPPTRHVDDATSGFIADGFRCARTP